MTSWIEPPPKQKGMGCLGKGCLLITAFLVLLIIAFVIGFYVGTKPKEIPQVPTSVEEQNAVKARWDEFDANRNEPAMTPAVVQPAPVSDATPTPEETPLPAETPASPNRIELSANGCRIHSHQFGNSLPFGEPLGRNAEENLPRVEAERRPHRLQQQPAI